MRHSGETPTGAAPRAEAFRDADQDRHFRDVVDAIELQYTLPSFRAYKNAVLRELALRPGATVADLGSGLGHDAVAIGALVGPTGACVGVDLSARLVDLARARVPAGLANVSFIVGSAVDLDLEVASLDAVKADRLLMHLDEPHRVLTQAHRVLRPGGRVAIVEPDCATVTITSPDRAATRRFTDAWCDSFRHGWIGRDLPRLARDAGFQDVALSGYLVVAEGFAAVDMLLEVSRTVARIEEKAEPAPGSLTAWLDSLRDPAATDPVTATVTMFLVTGRR
ncbi:methyltransferase domain-containing protein [Frankia sp. AgB32]|uniref:methyltransferase domain-containing protein n=1 Tax=Frankia sp. AgB32 TaxID=631119 RepID=UPI00200DF815|nr:methyltransferase domain-containing protein [Frankia sp. AgB32]MCK9896175.1 methyltransferase domain-containing protein [Frankia sp. AgB32]